MSEPKKEPKCKLCNDECVVWVATKNVVFSRACECLKEDEEITQDLYPDFTFRTII